MSVFLCETRRVIIKKRETGSWDKLYTTIMLQPPPSLAEIESFTGKIAGRYACIYKGSNGVLFAGSQGLLFSGVYLMFGNKITISWDVVRQVLQFNHGIEIWTKQDVIYNFSGIPQPGRVCQVLARLHNLTLLDQDKINENQEQNPVDVGRMTVVRRNSDPSQNTHSLSMDEDSEKWTAIPLLPEEQSKNQEGEKNAVRRNSDPSTSTHSLSVGEDSDKLPTKTLLSEEESNNQDSKKNEARQDSDSSKGIQSLAMSEDSDKLPTKPLLSEGKSNNQDDKKKTENEEPKKTDNASGDFVKTTTSSFQSLLSESSRNSFKLFLNGMSAGEVKEVLGDVNLEPIPCSHGNFAGKLHVGSKGLYFSGSTIWTTGPKLSFPMDRVANLEPLQGGQKQGICLTTTEGKKFEFIEVNSSSKTISLSAACSEWNKMKERHLDQQQPTDDKTPRSLIRVLSDPQLNMNYAPVTPSEGRVGDNTTTQEKKTSPPVDQTRTIILPAQEERLVEKPLSGTVADPRGEWTKLVAKRKTEYPNLLVEDRPLHCTLLQFYQIFLGDDAKHAIAKFNPSGGITSLVLSEWKFSCGSARSKVEMPPNSILTQTRDIQFNKAMNAPMAPPKAGIRQEQRLTWYGTVGMCLETRTIVSKDVPLSDCFNVEDRIRIEAKGLDSVSVSMEFRVTFVKYTIFKSLVTTTANAECTESSQRLVKFMSQSLETAKDLPVPEIKAPEPRVQPVVQSERFNPMVLMWFVVPAVLMLSMILLVQFYIVYELRSIRADFGLLYKYKLTNLPLSPTSMESLVIPMHPRHT